jgi:hypothetical protein
MTKLAPTKVKTRSNVRCHACDVTMRLFGIEAHPNFDRTDLRTYVCPNCDGVQTETVPSSSRRPSTKDSEMVRPIDSHVANGAFDTKTTRLLGSTFDATWEVVAAGSTVIDAPQVAVIREILAKCILEMVQKGERNPDRIVENALRQLNSAPRSDARTAIYVHEFH